MQLDHVFVTKDGLVKIAVHQIAKVDAKTESALLRMFANVMIFLGVINANRQRYQTP